MARLRALAVLASLWLALGAPIVAGAASPSPSPSLNSFLALPPETDYVERTPAQGLVEGPLDIDRFVEMGTARDPGKVRATLVRDGFISAFGKTWAQEGTQRIVIEAVAAFTGAAGAKKWLASSEAAEKESSTYKGPLAVDGIAPYYAGHFYVAVNKLFIDQVAFVKGNDFFYVWAVSGNDDLGDMASVQAKKQYELAPDSTIPKSQWVEDSPDSTAFDAGQVAGTVIVGLFVLAVIGIVIGLVIRAQKRPAVVFGAMVGLTLSPDGRYWWDGQAWKDTALEVPPTAQRSGDGRFWWDGRGWRPVP